MRRVVVSLPLAFLAASCVAIPGDAAVPGPTLAVRPMVAGAEPGAGASTSVLAPYGVEAIAHLTLRLYALAGSTETPVVDAQRRPVMQDLTDGDYARTVTFGDLKPNTTYRVRAFAYKAPGTDPNDLISTAGASPDEALRSYVDVRVGTEPAAAVRPLRVRLTAPGAIAPLGLAVTNGTIVHRGVETITVDGEAATR